MAYPDSGPLLDEHLDELELLCSASENEGQFPEGAIHPETGDLLSIDFVAVDYILGWHDRHDRQLLEVARWALANGWRRSKP